MMKRSRWLLLGMAAVLAMGLFAAPATAARTLSFVTEPAHAVKGQTITGTALDAEDGTVGGPFVAVLAAANTRVTLTITGTSTRLAQVRAGADGIATFPSISIGSPGEYTLTATASGWDPDVSRSFLIFFDGDSCGGSNPCDPSTGPLPNGGMTANVVGTSSGGGVAGVALDIQDAPVCPGDDPLLFNHGPSVLSAFWDSLDGEAVITLLISKAWDQRQANNGASFYQVCFAYDIPGKTFTDRFGNENVTVGLLRDCGPREGEGPPCVQSRSKDRKGNVQIVVRSLVDPRTR